MPTYDYVCKTCGKSFEYFQSIKADKLSHCPEEICEQASKGAGMVERKISSGAGVIFTGSGFYETDYVRKSAGDSDKSAPAKKATGAAGDSGGASSSSDTKTTSKTTTTAKSD